MPIYEYYCRNCEAKFELLRPFRKADEPATCPRCREESDKRLLSVFACIGRGDGAESGGGGCASCSGGSCASCRH